MRKELLVTVGSMVAVGAVVFGGGLLVAGSLMGSAAPTAEHNATKTEVTEHGASPEHAAPPEHAPSQEHAPEKKAAEGHGGHGDSKASEEQKPALSEEEQAAEKAQNKERMEQFALSYNDHFARGNYDDARATASKALALTGRTDPLWLRRMADATFQSEALSGQQRQSKAYELYSELLSSAEAIQATSADREWAAYRAAECLRQQGRWDGLISASQTFLKSYPESARRHEVRLLVVQGKHARGLRKEARAEAASLISDNPPANVRARALIELAQIDRERANSETEEAVVAPESTPSEHQAENPAGRAEADEQPAHAVVEREVMPNGIPFVDWNNIVIAARAGDFRTARHLLATWTDPTSILNPAQRAQATMSFAKLLRELPNLEK